MEFLFSRALHLIAIALGKFGSLAQPIFSEGCIPCTGGGGGAVLNTLLFIKLPQELSRKLRSGCTEVLLLADYLALVSESFEGLNEKLVSFEGSAGVKRPKKMSRIQKQWSEKAENVGKNESFLVQFVEIL